MSNKNYVRCIAIHIIITLPGLSLRPYNRRVGGGRSLIKGGRGTFIDFSSPPPELIRTPAYWYSRKKFSSGLVYTCLVLFSILPEQKRLLDNYLMHTCLILSIW